MFIAADPVSRTGRLSQARRHGDRLQPLRHWRLSSHSAVGGHGKLNVRNEFWDEGIIGLILKGRVKAAATVLDRKAIIPQSSDGLG